MVRTTTGPAEKKAQTQTDPNATKPLASDKDSNAVHRAADLDDATWGQIESMARSQNSTPADVIKRAITAQYGEPAQAGAYHSGMDNDPTLTAQR